jgi:hypothetical protein
MNNQPIRSFSFLLIVALFISAQAFAQQPVGPTIKGLSIGMDFQEAINVLGERLKGKSATGLFGEALGVPYEIQGPFGIEEGPLSDMAFMAKAGGFTGPYVAVMPGIPCAGLLRADEQNAVLFISFTAPLVKTLFEQAASLDIQEFAQEFASAYGVDLQPNQEANAYEARLPDGVLVYLGEDFSLRLEKTQSSSEVKSAFD